jgi:uncharacterized glyoxalase superfamily protein PhnB
MPANRSVPTDVLVAHVVYEDVGRAVEWLERVLGLREHYRYGDPSSPSGAQVRAGDAVIMLKAARPGWVSPARAGHATQMLTLFTDDVEAHHARAQAAGATIVEALNETPYGERQYAALDLEGHTWLVAQHVRDVDPAEWGATVA